MLDVVFHGSAGRIEGRYLHCKQDGSPIALVLHSHPHHGCTMNNKVPYNLFHIFARRGFSVLRFNFRGVGRSQGSFDSGQGELADAATALDWLQSHNQNATQCWVAGHFFGAWIGMQLLMRRPEIASFISTALPADNYDFTFLAPCPSSGLIVHGSKDQISPIDAARKTVEKLQKQRDITIQFETIMGADHDFRKHLQEMADRIDRYIGAHG